MGQLHNKKLWTQQEDQVLRQIVQMINSDKWNDIANKFQQLFYKIHGRQSKRNGKQCRQRWYNKLHPALQKNLDQWAEQQQIALINLYKELGPKWSKIIVLLVEQGYTRRSDNSIKNHFHMIVKKRLKQLNNFVQQYNKKGKRQGLFYQKPKKKYSYPKNYSIQRMAKMNRQLKISNSVNYNQKQNLSNQRFKQNQELNNQKFQQGTTQKLRQIVNQVILTDKKQDLLQQTQKIDNLNDQQNTIKQQNQQNYLKPLKQVQKVNLDKFLLWVHDKKEGRLQILNRSIDQIQLRSVRNSFLQYIKNPSKFTQDQAKQLVQGIGNYSKKCKKIGKKAVLKKIKQRQGLSKSQIQKVSKKLYQKIVQKYPQHKKALKKNKLKIQDRLLFLAQKVYNKQQQLQEQINKEYFIRKEEQAIIISMIIEQATELYKKHLQEKQNDKQIKNEKKYQWEQNYEQDQNSETNKNLRKHQYPQLKNKNNQQKNSQIEKTKKIRRIKRGPKITKNNQQNKQYKADLKTIKEQKPLFGQFMDNQQEFFNKDIFNNQLNFNLPYNQIKTQNAQQNPFKFKQNIQQNGLNKTKSSPIFHQNFNTISNKKVQQKYQVNQKEIKQKDTINQQNLKTNNKKIGSQMISKIPHKKPFDQNHVESQKSSFSLTSRKSQRPNRIIIPEQQKAQQFPFFKQLSKRQHQGSFQQIKRQFPDFLVRSIQLNQQNDLNRSGKYLNSQEPGSPIHSNKSNFIFCNYQKNNTFISNPGSSDPFKLLNNSQQFNMFNNQNYSKQDFMNFNPIQKQKSVYKSCQYMMGLNQQITNQPRITTLNKLPSIKPQRQNNFTNNSFLQNIRNISQNEVQWKNTKVYNFMQNIPQRFPNQPVQYHLNNSNKGLSSFNPFNSQPIDFQIPQKLIQTAKNPNFPIRNYNDYSLNYQHINSIEFSKVYQFDRMFGLNSARLSQIDYMRSQQKNQQNRSRSKQYDRNSNMFKSQRIHSINQSCQYLNKSRQLSNSCIYSSNGQKQKSIIQSVNQQNIKNLINQNKHNKYNNNQSINQNKSSDNYFK